MSYVAVRHHYVQYDMRTVKKSGIVIFIYCKKFDFCFNNTSKFEKILSAIKVLNNNLEQLS